MNLEETIAQLRSELDEYLNQNLIGRPATGNEIARVQSLAASMGFQFINPTFNGTVFESDGIRFL